MSIPLLVLNGPTAVGKTEVSLELAGMLNGEIISADSMQVYRGMDIGTAKIRPDEMRGIPHHMIDIIDPDEEFSVLIFKKLAARCIEEIAGRGHLPIIAGGTGFYIQAVLYDIDFTEYDDSESLKIRSVLEDEYDSLGAEVLFERLRNIDPEYAAVIHPNNRKRVLHGLEYHSLTGKKLSEHNREQSERTSPYDFGYYVLNDRRDVIYDRINRRVDMMMEAGLEREVRGLLQKGYGPELQSMQGIGYKEMCDFILGGVPRGEAVENIKRETRHFAKKQLTWFKREKDVEFVDVGALPDRQAAAEYVCRRFTEKTGLKENF